MKLLFLSSNNEDLKFFTQVASKGSFTFKPVASARILCDELLADKSAIVVVDVSTQELYNELEKQLSEKIGLFNDIVNANHFFFVADRLIHECNYLMQSDVFGHYIQRSFATACADMLAKVMKGAFSDEVFNLESYFKEGTKFQSLKVTSSLQKVTIVDSLKDQMIKIGFKARIAAIISTAIDELIMNAIFDAPVNEMGKRIHAQTPRNANVPLEGKNQVQVKLAFDGEYFAVSVQDQHGSLEKKKLLAQHLGKSYLSKNYDTRSITVGAGLGVANIFRNSSGLIFCCEAGSRTTVHIFFKKTESFKEFKDEFRFLSTFTYFPVS